MDPPQIQTKLLETLSKYIENNHDNSNGSVNSNSRPWIFIMLMHIKLDVHTLFLIQTKNHTII